MNANWHLVTAFAALLLPARGQQSLESAYRTTGTAVVATFESQRQVLQTSSAVILEGRKETGYGVVISADGSILTKASELPEAKMLSVTVDQTIYREVKVVSVDPVWDVALLKIAARGLVPVVYAPTSAVPQGTWVIANGATTRTARRLLAGVVSAAIREIPASGGAALGVILNAQSKALVVDKVNEKSGAKEAGLEPGDVILSIEDRPIKKMEEVGEILKERKAGALVRVTFRRKGEEVTVNVRLMARAELFTDQMFTELVDLLIC